MVWSNRVLKEKIMGAMQMVNGVKRALVFDSGVGGLSVLDAIAASGFALELDYAADNAWLPYGLKSDARIARARAGVADSAREPMGAGHRRRRLQHGVHDRA